MTLRFRKVSDCFLNLKINENTIAYHERGPFSLIPPPPHFRIYFFLNWQSTTIKKSELIDMFIFFSPDNDGLILSVALGVSALVVLLLGIIIIGLFYLRKKEEQRKRRKFKQEPKKRFLIYMYLINYPESHILAIKDILKNSNQYTFFF